MESVAVTGIGVIAPNGLGLRSYWAGLLQGRSGIRAITAYDSARFPFRLAGTVEDFVARDHLPSRLLPQTDRVTQLAVAAADWAMQDCGATDLTAMEIGVASASSSGGFDFGQRELQKLWGTGPELVSAYMSFAWFYAVNSGQIAIRHDLRGPVGVMVAEQAGGLDAVAQARRKVVAGTAMMVTGAVDSSLCPYGIAAQAVLGRCSPHDDPTTAYLPFDHRAAGHVPGEGGAILTVESVPRARARQAHSYGEIAGYAATFDPPPGSARPSTLRRAIESALADADLAARDIGVVYADAAAIPELDEAEAQALAEVFGPRGVAVTAPKSAIGRLYSGAAPLDLVTALLSLSEGVIPPTLHVSEVRAELDIDLVIGSPRAIQAEAALVIARGVGGFNSAMVVRRPR
ncbi:ketosynthase chain-length factor [Nocardia asteroides]